MAANTFALGSPRATEPYQVESTLLNNAVTGPLGARLMAQYLPGYQIERNITQGAYDQQVQRQNQFAYEQLLNQMREERLKSGVELFGKTGGAELLAASPELAGSLIPGMSPGALLDLANMQRNTALAGQLKDVGQGSYGLVQAGLPPSAQGIGSMIPYAGVTQGVPLGIQEAQIHAAAAAAAASRPQITYHMEGTPDDFGIKGPSVGWKATTAPTDQQINQGTATADRIRRAQGGTGGGGGAGYGQPGSISGPPGTARTNVGPGGVPPDVQRNAQVYVNNLGRSSNPGDRAKYKDIIQNMPGGGGNVILYRRPDGSYGVQGKTGQY